MGKEFEYFAPKKLEEALALLSKYQDKSKVIAGGQSLLILMKQGLVNPDYLIDIKAISALDYIQSDKKEGLRIGSLTTHRTVETSPFIRKGFSVLAEMEHQLASVEIRNWGTIGGNLCHGDPAGDLAPVLIVLNGHVKMTSLKGEKIVAVEDFFKDYFETALKYDELVTEIQVPNPPEHTGTAYTRFVSKEVDTPIVGTAVSITLNSKRRICEDVKIAFAAVAPVPMRAENAEKVLIGKEVTDKVIEEVAREASKEAKPITDMHATEVFRREIVKILVKRVAEEALTRAKRA